MAMQWKKYSLIRMNKALRTSGLIGGSRPDIIGIAREGLNLLVEVTSYSQTNAAMHAKLDWIITQNANCTKAVVGWAGMLARLFSHF